MSDKRWKCAMCGDEFVSERPDGEAKAEAEANFGSLAPEEMAVVCDDCYQKIDPQKHPHLVEESIQQTLAARLRT